ncbi:MAG: hypothetical protein SFW07_05025 [Gammaproteobacteria bacterium]|nr:hypothetical protein [Gammaproteobacteria bacterium]
MITLLSIIIVWTLFKYANLRGSFSRMRAFEYLCQKINLSPAMLSFILLVFFAVVLHGLRSHFYPLYVLFGIVILAYGWSYEEKHVVIPGTLNDQVRFAFLNALYEPFAVLFWFVILGSLGVLLYDFARRANLSRYFLDWPAARILGLGYALAGYFPPAFRYWTASWKNLNTTQFLEECGMLALTGEEKDPTLEVEQAHALVQRAEIMMLLALVLVCLGQWVS